MFSQPGNGIGTQQVHRQTQVMLAGAGEGHGLPGLGIGGVVGHAQILIFLGPQIQDLLLLGKGAEGGVEGVLVAGGNAVRKHPLEGFQGHLGDPVVVHHSNQVGVIASGNSVFGIHQHYMDALGGEVVYSAVDLQGAHSGGAVFLEEIAVFAQLEPAGDHIAVLAEVIALAVDLCPFLGKDAGFRAVVTDGIPLPEPAGEHHTVAAEEVFVAV